MKYYKNKILDDEQGDYTIFIDTKLPLYSRIILLFAIYTPTVIYTLNIFLIIYNNNYKSILISSYTQSKTSLKIRYV